MLEPFGAISESGLSADPFADASRQGASYIAAKRRYRECWSSYRYLGSNAYRLLPLSDRNGRWVI